MYNPATRILLGPDSMHCALSDFSKRHQTNSAPHFLIELQPWSRSLSANLADFFRPQPPALRLTSKPAAFWSDVLVARPLPWRSLVESGLLHVVAIAAMVNLPGLWSSRHDVNRSQFPTSKVLVYYDVSEYLPPIYSGGKPARIAKKGRPEFARQRIVSLPPEPENSTQTIAAPSPTIIEREAKLPNLVISTPVPQAPPVAAVARSPLEITLPGFDFSVPAPAPHPQRELAHVDLPKLPPAAVIEPSLDVQAAQRKLGEINIGRFEATAALLLPIAEQRTAITSVQSENKVPPPPSSAGTGSGMQAAGQLLALSLYPASPGGPIEFPGGSRRGVFATSPAGIPGAPGTPDIAGGGVGTGGTDSGEAGVGPGRQGLQGISIAVRDVKPGSAAVVAAASPLASTSETAGATVLRNLMVAAAGPPLADLPHESPSTVRGVTRETQVEEEIFSGKKYYSMILNMPNLTSSGGSWIIRFAELKESGQRGDLTAPVAMDKVDPAYPPDLMRDHVEGVVTLYAVIHSDGSVGEIRVLEGVDERLDRNARSALSRWRFRPAMRNGAPVDLEAVVHIPFVLRKKGL